MAGAWWMHGGCVMDARWMPGGCMADAWQVPELLWAAGPMQHLPGTGARPVRMRASGSAGRALLGGSGRRPCVASANTNYINCPAGEQLYLLS